MVNYLLLCPETAQLSAEASRESQIQMPGVQVLLLLGHPVPSQQAL